MSRIPLRMKVLFILLIGIFAPFTPPAVAYSCLSPAGAFPNQEDNNAYWVCHDFEALPMKCPPKSTFDPESKTCTESEVKSPKPVPSVDPAKSNSDLGNDFTGKVFFFYRSSMDIILFKKKGKNG